jgi:hypothetical protein
MTNAKLATLHTASSLLSGCLLLAAGTAFAQTTSSSFSATTSGTIGTPPGGATVSSGATPETISCTGTVKLATTAVMDPGLPPIVVVTVDARGLTCVGQTSKTSYLNTGFATLTRRLVTSDVVQMTFALYPNTAGGYMNARTGMVTATLNYDTTTGALTSASAAIGNF